jgi:hypothetical protein
MERVGRILAFRDYAKRSIQANPRGFNLTFPDLARAANRYAFIVRKFRRGEALSADQHAIIARCQELIRIQDANEARFQRGERAIPFVWPANEGILPPEPARANRAAIEAQVRAEVANGLVLPDAPAAAPGAAAPGALADDVIAAMVAAGIPQEEINEARALAAAVGPAPAAALGAALRREPSADAAARAAAAAVDAGPAAVVAAADVAAANPGIAQRVWNYFFDFWANPGHIEGGMRTRKRRSNRRSSNKTRQRR